MRLPPLDKPSIWSQESVPVSEEGTRLQSQEIRDVGRATEGLVERQKATIDAQAAEILSLKASNERYAMGYRATKEKIAELYNEIEKLSRNHRGVLEKQNKRIRAMEDRLNRREGLPATKPTERPFSSSSDRISETEVLGTVRDLNEHTFQVAAHLAEELEEFSSSRTDGFTIAKEDIEALSRSYGATLVQQTLERNAAAVTFLVQSCLCELAAQITSSWRHNQELKMLRSVYRPLSPSEGQEVSTRWRSLAKSYLSEQSSHSVSITRRVADILWITGSFPSTRHSFDFVKAKASKGIETIDRLVMRLESILIADIVSSDMRLLFESPCTVFNDVRMAKEIEFDETFAPGREDRVVATTEVGVEKSVGEGQGEGRGTEILLKAKVVLEKDLMEL